MKAGIEKALRPFKCVYWFVGGLCGNIKQGLLHTMGNVHIYNRPLWFVFNPKGYQIKARQIRKALAVLQPGDVVVRKYNTYLSSYFIPGRFSHSGLYVGKKTVQGLETEVVVHALGSGVQMQDAMDFFMCCDEFAILRPKNHEDPKYGGFHLDENGMPVPNGSQEESVTEKACRIATSYIGATYDYKFDICEDYKNEDEVQKRTKSVYCHELTRSCYPDLDIPCLKPSLWNGMIRSNKKQFLAQSFFESPDFDVVYDSFYSEIH